MWRPQWDDESAVRLGVPLAWLVLAWLLVDASGRSEVIRNLLLLVCPLASLTAFIPGLRGDPGQPRRNVVAFFWIVYLFASFFVASVAARGD